MAVEEHPVVPLGDHRRVLAGQPLGKLALHREHQLVEVFSQPDYLHRPTSADCADGCARRRAAYDQAQLAHGLCNALVHDEYSDGHDPPADQDEGKPAVGELVGRRHRGSFVRPGEDDPVRLGDDGVRIEARRAVEAALLARAGGPFKRRAGQFCSDPAHRLEGSGDDQFRAGPRDKEFELTRTTKVGGQVDSDRRQRRDHDHRAESRAHWRGDYRGHLAGQRIKVWGRCNLAVDTGRQPAGASVQGPDRQWPRRALHRSIGRDDVEVPGREGHAASKGDSARRACGRDGARRHRVRRQPGRTLAEQRKLVGELRRRHSGSEIRVTLRRLARVLLRHGPDRERGSGSDGDEDGHEHRHVPPQRPASVTRSLLRGALGQLQNH